MGPTAEEEEEVEMEVIIQASRECTAAHPTDVPAATTPAIEAVRWAAVAMINEIKDQTTDKLNRERRRTDTPEHRHQIAGD